MLHISNDWQFSLDDAQSKIWLTPRGEWGIKVVCERTEVPTLGSLPMHFAPKLTIDGLDFDGVDWRELVGLEIFQQGAWRGDGDPEASIQFEDTGDLYETKLRVVAARGDRLEVHLEGLCDIFFDDGHDTNVKFVMKGEVRFDGVHFRFRAEGADSRDPAAKAVQLLDQYLEPSAFGLPRIESLSQPGLFHVHFPPAAEETAESVDLTVSTELRVLHQSGSELLSGMIQLEWLELEGALGPKLIQGFVEQLEAVPDRGSARAERIVEWLIDQDGVGDVHCTDEELGALLDKWW